MAGSRAVQLPSNRRTRFNDVPVAKTASPGRVILPPVPKALLIAGIVRRRDGLSSNGAYELALHASVFGPMSLTA